MLNNFHQNVPRGTAKKNPFWKTFKKNKFIHSFINAQNLWNIYFFKLPLKIFKKYIKIFKKKQKKKTCLHKHPKILIILLIFLLILNICYTCLKKNLIIFDRPPEFELLLLNLFIHLLISSGYKLSYTDDDAVVSIARCCHSDNES